MLALTRAVPSSIDQCELTHLEREPIDYARAVREHAAYEDCLRRLDCHVQRLPELPDHPDSVFVEDTAVVFDRVAVVTRPGAVSRRGEVPSVMAALERHRPLAYIQPPGTLDGGDVLVTPGVVFVGVSGRTNSEGASQLATILAPHGFQVVPLPVTGCLHLKSAVTALPPLPSEGGRRDAKRPADGGTARPAVLINPDWIDPACFAAFDVIEVDPREPFAANVLTVGDRVVCAEAHTETRRRLQAHGIPTLTVPAAELARAEGGLTCCSLLVVTL